ncbi:MAG: IS6 family transposase, partial [Pseudomonadota bacterium]
PRTPFCYFKTSPEIIQLAVMMCVRFPLSLRNVEDPLHERGVDICQESVRFWVDRFGTHFAGKIRKRRASYMRQVTQWQWHLDEMFVKIRGETHYLWRAVDHEGEVLGSYVTKTRDKAAALKLLRKAMKRYGNPETLITDRLRSYGAAMKEIGNIDRRKVSRHLNNRAENSHLPFRRRERAMLRFRRMRSLQKFASMHSSVHNHFNLDRPVNPRTTFKSKRDAALLQWREMTAA